MNYCNTNYEYKQVNTRDIFVDELYQRNLNQTKISRILKDFNPCLINACKVSLRDGKLWVFDGQHTIAALKKKNGGRDCIVDCKVFYGLTRLDECNLFIAQNGASSPVQANEKMRAMYNNGDKDVINMVRICEKIGLKIDFRVNKAQNRVIALAALSRSYLALDHNQFADMMDVIHTAWDGASDSLTAEILTGMTKFYAAYYGEFNRKRLISRLSKINPTVIVRDGKVLTDGGGTKYAKVILNVYNQNSSSGKLSDKL